MKGGSLRMYRVENTVSNSTSIVASVSFAAGTCLPSLCLEAALVYLLISRSLQSNGSTRYNTYMHNGCSGVRKHPTALRRVLLEQLTFYGSPMFITAFKRVRY
jgi:hypothetical protein